MLNRKRLATIVVCISMIILLVVGAVWTYLVTSYESDLGTSNTVLIYGTNGTVNSSDDNHLVELSFDDGGEDLLWSSLDIEIEIAGDRRTCSFGVQSNPEQSESLITANLGSDGLTFTTQVDATSDDKFTQLDVANQVEGDDSDHWMRFSSTDIYLEQNVSWGFIADVEFSDVVEPISVSPNNTEERLDWYTYDMSVHRVTPNEGVYVLNKGDMWFKISFLTYYNSEDDSRFPTMKIAALNGSQFPALENPELVIPSPCLILTEDLDIDYWNGNETIILIENGIDLCNQSCIVNVNIAYETVAVEISKSEIQIA